MESNRKEKHSTDLTPKRSENEFNLHRACGAQYKRHEERAATRKPERHKGKPPGFPFVIFACSEFRYSKGYVLPDSDETGDAVGFFS